MTKAFRPYWAEIGRDGGTQPAEVRRIDCRETEAFYQQHGWRLTKTAKPYTRPAKQAAPVDQALVRAELERGERVQLKPGRRVDLSRHPTLVRGARWSESAHHPEILPALWPGSFPKHRKGSRPDLRPARARLDGIEAILRDVHNVELLAVSTTKPSRVTRDARAFVELELWSMECSGISRRAIEGASGLTRMQLSRLIKAGRNRHPHLATSEPTTSRSRPKPGEAVAHGWAGEFAFRADVDWRTFVRPTKGEGPPEPSVADGGAVMCPAVLPLSELARFLAEEDPRGQRATGARATNGLRNDFDGVGRWHWRSTQKGGTRMTQSERIERLEEAMTEIGKLGLRVAQMFPDKPLVLSTVDAFLADLLDDDMRLAA